jgi:hypothetical protein
MRRNTVAIDNVLKKKYYQTKFSISSILKKKSTNIILKNKKIKKKNYVKKNRRNPQYFKEKKLQSENFNQVNI